MVWRLQKGNSGKEPKTWQGVLALGTNRVMYSVSFNMVTGTGFKKKAKSVSSMEFPSAFCLFVKIETIPIASSNNNNSHWRISEI